jgi:hypothetical protein
MANKKIIVSSGNGKRQTVPTISGTESLYIDDTTDTLVAKSGSLAALQVGSSGGILSASNGTVTVITGTSGSMLVANGSTWTSATSRIPVGAAGGDLTGSYPAPQVKSISNVTAGTLAVANGGTAKTTLTSGGILTGSASGVGTIPNTAGTYDTFSILKHNGTNWYMTDVSRKNFYEAYVGSYTWTKPAGARKIKVIMIGGGGGGSSGWLRNLTSQSVVGGGGGGSGGYSEVWFNVSNLADGATIPFYVGAGGSGGFRDVSNGATAGGSGERTAFGVSGSADTPTASNIKFFAQATGGSGGTNTNTVATGGSGGYGNIANGTAGGSLASAGVTPSAGTNNSKGPAGGGAGGGVSSTASVRSGSNGGDAGEIYALTAAAGGTGGAGALNTSATNGSSGFGLYISTGFRSTSYTIGTGAGGGGASGGATPGQAGIGGFAGYAGAGGGGGGAGYSNGSDGYYCYGGDGYSGYIAIITYY